MSESLTPEDGRGLGVPDPALTALWTGYRNAVAAGTARPVGDGKVFGHRVYWLEFPLADQGGRGSRVAVDRDSYRPIAIYGYLDGKWYFRERVLLAQTEPFSESVFRRRTPRLSSRQRGTGLYPRRSKHPFHLAKPWLTAGQNIEGVTLSQAVPIIVTAGARRSRGVELSYGFERVVGGDKWIRIGEVKKPANSEWGGIPRGYVKLMPLGPEHRFNGGGKMMWTGDLVANGVYVTVQTDLGRKALLAVARALKPV